jgi:hypothetical protein
MRTARSGVFAGLMALLLLAPAAWAQSRLPRCQGAYAVSKWTHCYGINMTNSGAIYRGEWVDDKFEGHGTYTYRNNAQYVGEFRANKREGQGRYTWPDGASYTGGYRDDQRSGMGTFVFPDGRRFVGEWRHDKRNGPGTEYGADGSVLRAGSWMDDKLVKPE